MNHRRAEAGFTLIEILVAVAILAIASAALTPMVLKYVNDGRRARSLSDAQTLGQSILAFQLDTGRWPVSNDGNINDAGEISRLVGLPFAAIAPAAIPTGVATAPGSVNWRGGGNGGTAAALEDLLIRNRSTIANPLYAVSLNPAATPGWNGPYIKEVPVDPWGSPYVVNVRYLDGATVTGVTTAVEQSHAVVVISAGANALFETSFQDATALTVAGGDDVAWTVEGQRP